MRAVPCLLTGPQTTGIGCTVPGMAGGRWWDDDVTGGQPPPGNVEMPRRFTRYLRWTWPVAVAACIPATAWLGDPGWAVTAGVWFAAGWAVPYQWDRVEYNAKKRVTP